MKKIVLAAAAVLAFSSSSAFAAQATGSASATIIAPISVTHTALATLNFGTFDASTGGSVTVSQAGIGSVGGSVNFVSGSVNSADAFTVAGDGNRVFTIVTTGGNVTSGANSMAFTTSAPATGTLAGGAGGFSVGGTLTVGSGQAVGSYTGSYTATVNYQ